MASAAEVHDGRVDRTGVDGASIAFGVPVVGEDDALRAVRAALELRDELGRLDAALADRHGLRLHPRAAVASGEVLVDEDLTVTGEPVVAGARLAATTAAGEVSVDADTLVLVRHAVTVDAASAPAARVLTVTDDDRRPLRLDAPLLGRDRQLAVLQNALAGVVADRRIHLVTVLGTAGVGKSRLVRELCERAGGDVTTLRGSCVAYGEAPAFRPLVEALTSVDTGGWDEALRVQHAVLADALSGDVASRQEVFRDTRLHLERLARACPLVLVIEDLHAAATDLLDLLDDVTAWSSAAPILVLCTARPELVDTRSSWGGGKASATMLALEPLAPDDCLRLVDALLGASHLPDPVRQYLTEASGGNPLFVEELLTTLVERNVLMREAGRWTSRELPTVTIPSSVTALLAARIDRLGAAERELLDLAAIVGPRFTRDLLAELVDDELAAAVDQSLAALVRRELIRSVDGSATFEFRHELVRDVAYASVPKRLRADQHARLAALLEQTDEPGMAETARFHRAQAEAYRAELAIDRSPE